MSLVTAVIMPVKLFIYIATQISSLLRTVINILKEEYGTIYVAILHGTTVFKKLDGIAKYYCRMITKPVYCSALNNSILQNQVGRFEEKTIYYYTSLMDMHADC